MPIPQELTSLLLQRVYDIPGAGRALAKTKDKDWITLNIGGVRVTTTKDTLTNKEPDSMLARMFSQQEGMYKLL